MPGVDERLARLAAIQGLLPQRQPLGLQQLAQLAQNQRAQQLASQQDVRAAEMHRNQLLDMAHRQQMARQAASVAEAAESRLSLAEQNREARAGRTEERLASAHEQEQLRLAEKATREAAMHPAQLASIEALTAGRQVKTQGEQLLLNMLMQELGGAGAAQNMDPQLLQMYQSLLNPTTVNPNQ